MSRIEDLPRYERLPGEYFAYQLEESKESFDGLQELLREANYWSTTSWYRTDRGRVLWMAPNQHQNVALGAGDYVTFRRDGERWSIISYAKADFESRYKGEGAAR